MQQCRYPSHHESGRSDTSGLVLIVALVVAGFVVVRLAVAAVRVLEAWWWTFTLTLAVAAAWYPEYDMRPVSEVISVTLTGGTDPAGDITPGSPVEFDTLRVGISPVERTDRGVRGGKAYYQASGIRVASVSSLRPLKSEAS